MNSVERVKAICKERKIPISRLERDLGYANAYISQLRKGVFPSDRLIEIAEYLSVSPDYLINGEDQPSTPDGEERRQISDDDLMFALWGDATDITEEDLEDVKRFAAFVRERKKKE